VNEEEAVMLARYVRALCPQQKFDEYTADAWGDVLANHDFDACKQAAISLGRKQPFIAPAEIIAEVQRGRDERLDDFQYEPDPDESPAEYIANRRAQMAAVAAGHRAPALPAPPKADRPALEVDHVGRLPAQAKPRLAATPRDVRCPYCGAEPGKPCKTGIFGRQMADVHGSRTDVWRTR